MLNGPMWVTCHQGIREKKPFQIQFHGLHNWPKLWGQKLCQAVGCIKIWCCWLDGSLRDRLVIVPVFLYNFLQKRLQSVHCHCNDWTSQLLLSASQVKEVISLVPMIICLYMLNTAVLSQIFKKTYNLIFSHFQKIYLNFVALLITDYVLLLWSGLYDLAYSDRNSSFGAPL